LLSSHAKKQFLDGGIADGSLRLPRLGRFRINLHRERGRAAAAIRLLPTRVPRLSELNLPPEVAALSTLNRGLVLVGGATGSGKTTTMAAIVDEINRRDARHIITVEDPIEYEHVHHTSIVEQIEIGADAPDFPTALRAALRQAPDVLVIGEMRDPESMRIALAAAETGHLVLSSLHTTDVA
ncbi:MAG: type IV pilus twitching motility protein PilT, partial [Gemmatimonadaceae bacterium]